MTQTPVPHVPPRSSVTLVVISLVLALVTVILYNVHIAMVRSDMERDAIVIYRLTRSMQPGDMLRSRDVEPRRIPREFADSFPDAISPTELGNRVDRERLVRAASQHEVLTHEMFTGSGGSADSLVASPGLRLVSLPVNSRTVPGPLRPGDWVDVEAPFTTGVGDMGVVYTVLERIQVKAIDQYTVEDVQDADSRTRVPRTYRTITIELAPGEATLLANVQRFASGDFELQLRNPADQAHVKIPGGGINPAVIALIEQRLGQPLPKAVRQN